MLNGTKFSLGRRGVGRAVSKRIAKMPYITFVCMKNERDAIGFFNSLPRATLYMCRPLASP